MRYVLIEFAVAQPLVINQVTVHESKEEAALYQQTLRAISVERYNATLKYPVTEVNE